jgi:hypothetical protein
MEVTAGAIAVRALVDERAGRQRAAARVFAAPAQKRARLPLLSLSHNTHTHTFLPNDQ